MVTKAEIVVKNVLKRIEKEYSDIFIKSFEEATTNKTNTVFNPGGKLRTDKKSRLMTSFLEGKKTKFQARSFNTIFESKLAYARIQERGGFIKSKGKMHNYFWFKFIKTKKVEFKRIALSVIKKGGVNIPKRPYLSDTSKAMKEILNTKEFQNYVIGLFAEEWQSVKR